MTSFKFKDILIQYISYGYVISVSLLLSILIARYLGPAEFGIYATAMSAGSILGILFDFGFRHVIQRETASPSARFKWLQPRLMASAMGFLVLVSALSMLVLCLLFPAWKITILCICTCFASIAISQFVSAFYKGKKQFIREGIHLAGARSISAIAILTLLFMGMASSNSILLAWGLGVLLWNLSHNRFAFSRIEIASFVSLLPILSSLFLIDISITIYFRADILLLQYFGANKNEIGYFSAALRLVEAFIMLGVPIRSMFQTHVRRENLEKLDDIKLFMQRLIGSAMVGAVFASGLYLMANPLIDLVYGERFSGASFYLQTLSWILVPAYMLAVISEMMIAKEVEGAYKYLATSITALMVILIIYIQTQLGIHGVVKLKVIMEAVFAFAGFVLIVVFLLKRPVA